MPRMLFVAFPVYVEAGQGVLSQPPPGVPRRGLGCDWLSKVPGLQSSWKPQIGSSEQG